MCHHDARKFEIDLRILMWTQSRTLICNVSVLTSDKINSCSTSLDDAEALIQQIIQSEEANQTIKVLNKTPRLVQTSTLPIPAIEVAFQASSGVTSVTWVFFKPDRYCEADKTRVFALTSVSKHNVPIVEFFNEVHKFHSSFKFNRTLRTAGNQLTNCVAPRTQAPAKILCERIKACRISCTTTRTLLLKLRTDLSHNMLCTRFAIVNRLPRINCAISIQLISLASTKSKENSRPG